MKKDRLRHDSAEIHNPKDIEAFEEDIDVDHALTFPHPKDIHGRDRKVDLMGAPNELDMDEDWDAQDAQPTDYEHEYSEGTNAYATDDPEQVLEEQAHEMGWVMPEEIEQEEIVEVMPSKFAPDEETEA